jgi:hypothetical protein
MKLTSPFFISSRLTPALQIAEGFSLNYDNGEFIFEYGGKPNGTGKIKEHVVTDYSPGACSNLQTQFEGILSFLSACLESRKYGLQIHNDPMKGENSDLFPSEFCEEIEVYSNEIDMTIFELNENTLIEE